MIEKSMDSKVITILIQENGVVRNRNNMDKIGELINYDFNSLDSKDFELSIQREVKQKKYIHNIYDNVFEHLQKNDLNETNIYEFLVYLKDSLNKYINDEIEKS